MKLLLTSAGLTNKSISNALQELVGKPNKEALVAFIPTAAFFERGDKGWLIENLNQIKDQGYKVDILDILGSSKEMIASILKEADVVFSGGGNNWYLMHCLKKQGLDKSLPKLLKDKVYAGISAGSMVASPLLKESHSTDIYKEFIPAQDIPALDLVKFYILPHLNSSLFPNVRDRYIKNYVGTDKTYALDDQSAIKVVDNAIEVVSGGTWVEFN